MMLYSKYPFLDSAKKFMPANQEFTEQYIHYAYKHLFDPSPEPNFPEMDVQVFLLSLIMLKNTDNKQLHKKWIENYCKQFEKHFLKDIHDESVRNEVLDFMLKSVPNDMVFAPQFVTMPIPYYLMFVSGMVGSEFKLVNQAVSNGKVSLYYPRFVLILRTKLQDIIFNRLKEKYLRNETINNYVDQLIKDHPIQTYNAPPTISNNKGVLPPCVQYMIDKAKTQHDLEHKERLILGIYMVKKEYSEDEILDIYSQLSDYKESVTKKGLKPLSRYQMYGCSKVEAEGCCYRDKDRLNRCNRISNPFNY